MSVNSEIGIISETNRKIDFEWTISDFFSYTEEDSKYYSPEFHVLNSKWKIEMRPNGQTKKFPGYLSLYLWRIKSTTPESVDFTFSIKTVDNVAENEKKTSWKCVNHEGFGWHAFIDRSKLQQKKDNLVPSGKLTILCTLSIKVDETDCDERKNELIADFKEMFLAKKCTDVTIKVKEKTFSAHKFILSARSPVLAAMFENEMIEKKTGFIDISDCDPEAFNDFLLYLYSGEFDPEKCNFFHLYKIGDKYDVPQLKLTCANFINCSISVENFCEIYLFGQKFNEEKILAAAQNFFNENFEKIVSLDSWVSMMEDEAQLTNNLLKALKRF